MNEPLLGGPGVTPATEEEKKEFKKLLDKPLSDLTASDLDKMQRIEWGLTKTEYISMKFPKG